MLVKGGPAIRCVGIYIWIVQSLQNIMTEISWYPGNRVGNGMWPMAPGRFEQSFR